jgi:hypothetical protein
MTRTSGAVVRQTVRRILQEALGDALPNKLFGKEGARTDLYNTTVATWSEGEVGKFKFVFTPNADKTQLSVVVSAEEGADDRAASRIQSAADEAVKMLTPTDWSGIGTSYTYIIPGGVSYKQGEEIQMNESWVRLAGLIK